MKPDFLLIGFPRCGTSWVDRILRSHPQIWMPEKKEVHFFDKHFESGATYYYDQFHPSDGQISGEATPSYLHKEIVFNRLYHEIGYEVKFIVCLRNPVDRLYSRYWNVKAAYKHNKHSSFEEKIESKAEFISEGEYVTHLQRYLNKYDLSQFHFILYDEIMVRPESVVEGTYDFLGVDKNWEPDGLRTRVNSAKSKKGVGKFRALYYLARALKRIKWFRLMSTVEHLNAKEYPPMNEKVREALIEHYKPFNSKLGKLLDMDLSHWDK